MPVIERAHSTTFVSVPTTGSNDLLVALAALRASTTATVDYPISSTWTGQLSTVLPHRNGQSTASNVTCCSYDGVG